MFCPECGKKVEEGALFCPECGTKIQQQAQATSDRCQDEGSSTLEPSQVSNNNAEQSQQPAPDKDAPSAAKAAEPSKSENEHNNASQESVGAKAGKAIDDAMGKFKSLSKSQRYGILGGGIAVVVIVAIVTFVLPLFGGVPTDAARQAFAQSSFAANGAVSSACTNASPYEIKDFKIEKQEDALAGYDQEYHQMAKGLYGTDQIKTVTFSGKIANESFETTFTGQTDFMNINGNWSPTSSSSQKIISKETKPLKGVDTLTQKSNSDNVSYSDFNSTLNESNGTYTSDATSTVTYTYWFATDTAKATQSFTFDPSSGWKSTGEAQVTDTNTEWTLKDKTFKYSGASGIFSTGTVDSSLTFGDASNGEISADYNISYTPNAGLNNTYITYKSASAKGTATGKVSHQFGNGSFSMQLSDSGQSVDITCKSAGWAGNSASKNAIIVDADTKTVYATPKNGTPSCIKLSSLTFNESTQTNA